MHRRKACISTCKRLWAARFALPATTSSERFQGWKRLDELERWGPHRLTAPSFLKAMAMTMRDLLKLRCLGHLIGDGCTLPRHAIQYTTQRNRPGRTGQRSCRSGLRHEDPATSTSRNVQVVSSLSVSDRPSHARSSQSCDVLADRSGSLWPALVRKTGSRGYLYAAFGDDRRVLASSLGDRRMHPPIAKSNRRYPAVYYATSSEGLARDVQSLLLRLGINARAEVTRSRQQGRTQYHVLVMGRTDILDFSSTRSAPLVRTKQPR